MRRDILDAKNYMDMGDYPAAIELLGKAIEVSLPKGNRDL